MATVSGVGNVPVDFTLWLQLATPGALPTGSRVVRMTSTEFFSERNIGSSSTVGFINVGYSGNDFAYGATPNTPPNSGTISAVKFEYFFQSVSFVPINGVLIGSTQQTQFTISGLSFDAASFFPAFTAINPLPTFLFGDDSIYGGSSRDIVYGYDGNDVIALYGGDDLAYGGLGDDTMYGGVGLDTAYGDNGNDVMIGDAGNDTLYGGAGSNVLFGGDGIDTLIAGTGNAARDGVNVVHGGPGNDLMYGGAAADYFYGGAGTDTISGDLGNDIFIASGETEGDLMYGGDGRDYFYAGNGADTIFAGAGVDVILAAGGDDIIYGGTGTDYAWGGAGDDSFVVAGTDGVLVINDFTAGGADDRVRLLGAGMASLDQAQEAMTYVAGINTTILTVDSDTNIWFIGVSSSQLTAADFLFA